MKVGVVLPIGGTDGRDGKPPSWHDTLAMARAVEDTGLDSGWVADHFFYRSDDGTEYAMNEAWTILTAIAASTERIELGPIVLCASFRNPGLTAKMATTLDDVSGGRLILGVGCGWHEAEYRAFGLPYDHRVGRFEEWIEIVVRLLGGERVTFDGRFHTAADAVLVPAPARRIPLLVAARRPRMHAITARWADAWNTAWYGWPGATVREQMAVLDAAEATTDRAGNALGERLVRTVGITVRDPDQDAVPEPEEDAIEGSADDVARALEAYAELGFAHVIVGLEPMTVRSVERLASAVRLVRG
jgi:alkanesulfonate monooxygenase SsuD/methylene tetrahydromethanopterin reductase-like flavin-dependent oxidoreductase (luciferase family)